MYPRYKKGIETLYDFPLVGISIHKNTLGSTKGNLSLDVFFEKLKDETPLRKEVEIRLREFLQGHKDALIFMNSHELTKAIFLDLSKVKEKDPSLYELIKTDIPLSLRAFYKVLIDLSIYVKGYSVGFRGGEPL